MAAIAPFVSMLSEQCGSTAGYDFNFGLDGS